MFRAVLVQVRFDAPAVDIDACLAVKPIGGGAACELMRALVERVRDGAADDFFFRFTRRLCCRDQLGGSDHGHPARKIARPKPLIVFASRGRARSGAVAAGDFFFRFTRRLCCRDELGGSDHGHPARKIARPSRLLSLAWQIQNAEIGGADHGHPLEPPPRVPPLGCGGCW